MFSWLISILKRQKLADRRKSSDEQANAPASIPKMLLTEPSAHVHLMPFDENLMDRARMQWQLGEWPSLGQLRREDFQHHPDRAKLSLLAAAARFQLGDADGAKDFLNLALEWGVSKKLVTRVLTSGVHNTLGRASALAGQDARALRHFQSAIRLGAPGSDEKLLERIRSSLQYEQLGLNSHPVHQINEKLN